MQTIQVAIENGAFEFICNDDLEPLLRQGKTSVRRVSHVEWKELNNHAGWTADMRPVGGPELGAFETRAMALAAEHQWLVDNREL